MNLKELKHQIIEKELSKFFIFTGVEIAIMNIYVNKISEVSGSTIVRADSVADIFKSASNRSLIKRSNCYVIRDDKDFMASEKAWDSVVANIKSDIVILLYTDVDKRSKFYNHFVDTIVEFEPVEDKWLCKYLDNEISLSYNYKMDLIHLCESDYGRMLLECDKIRTYGDVNTELSYDQILDLFMSDGTIHIPPQDVIFDLSDALCRREYKRTWDLYYESLASGENILTMLTVFYTNLKQILQVQSCKSKDIAEITGINPKAIYPIQSRCGYYEIWELVRAIKLLREIEVGIKTGRFETDTCIEYFLVNVL